MPQPIDMQTELGRMVMAERVQNAAARASMVAAQRAQTEEDDARVQREEQVNETPETQSEHVDEDGRRKNPFMGRRRRRDASAQPDGTNEATEGGRNPVRNSESGQHFDESV